MEELCPLHAALENPSKADRTSTLNGAEMDEIACSSIQGWQPVTYGHTHTRGNLAASPWRPGASTNTMQSVCSPIVTLKGAVVA